MKYILYFAILTQIFSCKLTRSKETSPDFSERELDNSKKPIYLVDINEANFHYRDVTFLKDDQNLPDINKPFIEYRLFSDQTLSNFSKLFQRSLNNEVKISENGKILINHKMVKEGIYPFTMNADGQIFVSITLQQSPSAHFSLLYDGPFVAAAGYLQVDEQSKVISVNNFVPGVFTPIISNQQFLDHISSKNINLQIVVADYLSGTGLQKGLNLAEDPAGNEKHTYDTKRTGTFSETRTNSSFVIDDAIIHAGQTEVRAGLVKIYEFELGDGIKEKTLTNYKGEAFERRLIYPNGDIEIIYNDGGKEISRPKITNGRVTGSTIQYFKEGKLLYEVNTSGEYKFAPDAPEIIQRKGKGASVVIDRKKGTIISIANADYRVPQKLSEFIEEHKIDVTRRGNPIYTGQTKRLIFESTLKNSVYPGKLVPIETGKIPKTSPGFKKVKGILDKIDLKSKFKLRI